jgi:hypothetical protein
MAQLDEFLAHMSGTVEALVLAFGALAATHPEPAKIAALLQSMSTAATTQEDAEGVSPAQAAYQAGTRSAVSRLANAMALAQQVRAMNQAGPTQ